MSPLLKEDRVDKVCGVGHDFSLLVKYKRRPANFPSHPFVCRLRFSIYTVEDVLNRYHEVNIKEIIPMFLESYLKNP